MNTITGAGGSSAGKKLLLVDGHSILNRAFYGMPDLTNAKGVHTGAVYGFLNILFSQIDELQPDYLTVAFDVHAPTFRHEAYAEYKGTRKSMPEELREQVPLMKKMLTAMGIPICEQAGLEADDILGTLAKKAQAVDMDVVLLSGDRDLLQIATDRICIRIPRTRKGQTVIDDFREAQVLETYGVTPLQFIEVKALMGDASDNIPGVPKVGEKTATQLIREFGSVDGVYEHLDEVKKPALHKTLAENEDKARMSLFLAAIKTDCDVELDMEKAAAGGYYTKEAFELCTELGFKNILPRFDRDVVEETAGGFEPLEIVEEKALAQMKDTLLSKIRSGQEMVIGVWPVLDFPGYGMESPAVLTGVGISSSPAGAKSADGNWFIRTDSTGENNAAVLSFLKELRTAVRESSTASDSRETSAASDLKESSTASGSKENTGSMLAVFGQKGHMFLWGIDAAAEFSEGIRMEGILDLLVGSYLVNPLKSDYEIEDVASEYLGISLQGAKSLFARS